TYNNKQVLMHGYRSAYVSHELEIKSLGLLQEMSYVVQDGAEIGAPESSSSTSKDDRVFAAALAHTAWNDWTKKAMIAQGLTYARVMKHERGELSLQSEHMNRAVVRFFQTIEERAQKQAETPTWRESRGLL